LRDPEVRARILTTTKSSPVKEGKLHLRTFLNGEGQIVLGEMGRAPGSSAQRVLALLDEVGDELELYLPVGEHRATWQGGASVIVASSLDDQKDPFGVDLDGNEVPLDRETPPEIATLALVPAESFQSSGDPWPGHRRSLQMSASLEGECDPTTALVECDDGTGSGGGVDWTQLPNGLYLTKLVLNDDGEGFPRGKPEIDLFTIVRVNSLEEGESIRCVGEEESGEFFFNWDDNGWDGQVRIATPAQLDDLPPEEGLLFQTWEDDDQPCVIRTSDNTVSALLESVDMATDGYDGLGLNLGSIQYAFAFIGSIIDVFGDGDDVVGEIVKQNCTKDGDFFDYTVLKADGFNGCADLFLNTQGTDG